MGQRGQSEGFDFQYLFISFNIHIYLSRHKDLCFDVETKEAPFPTGPKWNIQRLGLWGHPCFQAISQIKGRIGSDFSWERALANEWIILCLQNKWAFYWRASSSLPLQTINKWNSIWILQAYLPSVSHQWADWWCGKSQALESESQRF